MNFIDFCVNKASNYTFNTPFSDAWVFMRDPEGLEMRDSYSVWCMGGELWGEFYDPSNPSDVNIQVENWYKKNVEKSTPKQVTA